MPKAVFLSDMYRIVRGPSASTKKMHAVRTSFRALGAPPASMSYAARAAVKASATKNPDDYNQNKLIEEVAEKLGYDKSDVGAVVSSTLQLINDAVTSGNKVALSGAHIHTYMFGLLVSCPDVRASS